MSEWRVVPLGDVCELKRGYDLPNGSRRDGRIPVVSSSGSTGWHDEAKVSAPGVVTGRYGTLGQVFYVAEDFWPLNTALYVRDFKGNEPRFVAALLRSMNLAQYDGAAAVPGLNRNHLHTVPVRVPAVRTQQAIADVVRAFDDLIENNRRRVEVLEQMARAIYREWFVEFRYPGHSDVPLVDSALGPIPEAWECAMLGELAEVRRGISWERSNEAAGGTPVVTIPNVRSRLVLAGATELASVTDADRLRFGLRDGDLLLIGSNGNPDRVGHVVRVPDAVEALFASFLMRVRVHDARTSSLVVFHQLTDPRGAIAAIRATAVGATGLRNLRITALREAQVLRPPAFVVARFESLCGPPVRLADQLGKQNDRLESIRDALLPKLVTGQIDVSTLDLDALTVKQVA